MKKSFAPILVVAFAIAVVCTIVFYSLVAGKLATGAQANATPMVVVASRDLALGSAVGIADVKAAPWTGGPAPEGAYRSATQVEGLVAISDIAAGEPLLNTRLASKRNGGGLGIPSGMRAISVQVHDSSGVVAMLKPGHRVDVQAVYARSGSLQDAELRTVLENVEVLRISPAGEPGPGRPANPVATLLVTPAEADVAGLADAIAKIRLVLRNPLDQDRSQRGAVGLVNMLRGGGTPGPTHRQPMQTAAAPMMARPAGVASPGGLSLASQPGSPGCNNPKSAEPAEAGK